MEKDPLDWTSDVPVYASYLTRPSGRLRQDLVRDNLERAIPALAHPALEVLDAGCGPGEHGRYLAVALGHRVCFYDATPAMLDAARAGMGGLTYDPSSGHSFVTGRIEEADTMLAGRSFDLILCHAVLEFTADPGQTLRGLARLLRPGGYLSVMCANHAAMVLHEAIIKQNLPGAEAALDQTVFTTVSTGRSRYAFKRDDLIDLARAAKLKVAHSLGVRVVTDYLSEDLLSANWNAAFDLERRLGWQEPYLNVARYIHVIFLKPVGK